jgi:hypothetical protein
VLGCFDVLNFQFKISAICSNFIRIICTRHSLLFKSKTNNCFYDLCSKEVSFQFEFPSIIRLFVVKAKIPYLLNLKQHSLLILLFLNCLVLNDNTYCHTPFLFVFLKLNAININFVGTKKKNYWFAFIQPFTIYILEVYLEFLRKSKLIKTNKTKVVLKRTS